MTQHFSETLLCGATLSLDVVALLDFDWNVDQKFT